MIRFGTGYLWLRLEERRDMLTISAKDIKNFLLGFYLSKYLLSFLKCRPQNITMYRNKSTIQISRFTQMHFCYQGLNQWTVLTPWVSLLSVHSNICRPVILRMEVSYLPIFGKIISTQLNPVLLTKVFARG